MQTIHPEFTPAIQSEMQVRRVGAEQGFAGQRFQLWFLWSRPAAWTLAKNINTANEIPVHQ